MALDRRGFLKASALAGGALGWQGVGAFDVAAHPAAPQPPAAPGKPLRILILGGTGFIGPHQVERARPRPPGHAVQPGKTNASLFRRSKTRRRPERARRLAALKGRTWDVVIDNPAQLPRWCAGGHRPRAPTGHVREHAVGVRQPA
jgi:2'-hydroxyisoflavone reductase